MHAGVRAKTPARMLACWRACEMLACCPHACMRACPHACMLACVPACLHAGVRAKTPARMLACVRKRLPACVRKRLPACLKRLPACLLNACPHACFAAYALPAADRATPCSPFRGTHVCLHRRRPCIFKIEEFQSCSQLSANFCKKDWNMVPIYSQHLVFFLSFVGGCDFMVSLYLETDDL